MKRKYLSFNAYLRKLRLIRAGALLKCGISLKNTVTVDGHTIVFFTTNFIEYFLRAEESYTREKVTMYWIRTYIGADDVVFDVGANVGAYSLLIGKMVAEGRGRVYSFEPESANFSALNRNIRINNLSGKVIPYSLAFCDMRRASRFYLSDVATGSAMHSIDKPESDGIGFEPRHVQGVLADSVDSFVAESDVEFPNHIKIDVDGVEKKIVENMHLVLQDSRLKTIMIEIEITLSSGVIEKIIEDKGFTEIMREQWVDRPIYNVLYAR